MRRCGAGRGRRDMGQAWPGRVRRVNRDEESWVHPGQGMGCGGRRPSHDCREHANKHPNLSDCKNVAWPLSLLTILTVLYGRCTLL